MANATRVEEAPTIDGVLDDNAWAGATLLDGFLQRDPLEGQPVSDTFVASLRFNWFDVKLDQGDFQTSLLGLKAAYSFTPRIYLQALLQYSDQTDASSGNIRSGWLNTVGTGLFLVYNDLRHTGSLLETGIPRGPLDRSFVIKFRRLLNLTG